MPMVDVCVAGIHKLTHYSLHSIYYDLLQYDRTCHNTIIIYYNNDFLLH